MLKLLTQWSEFWIFIDLKDMQLQDYPAQAITTSDRSRAPIDPYEQTERTKVKDVNLSWPMVSNLL